ncbi:MAG: hypothetical protein AB1478_01155 [Nitrospirota bacterium]
MSQKVHVDSCGSSPVLDTGQCFITGFPLEFILEKSRMGMTLRKPVARLQGITSLIFSN